MNPILEVKHLKVYFTQGGGGLFRKAKGLVRAVDGVSFALKEGETLGLVGESGCGKSTTARACLQLIPPTGGSVRFEGIELTQLGASDLRKQRRHFQIIFQDPYASLNPRMTVEDIVSEPLRTFGVAKGETLRHEVQDLLRRVGLNPRYIRRFPHEFSGGQKQRIGIARALALKPKLIVADEPVSALDVSIQAQILNLLSELKEQFKLTYLFIAHDLAVVRHICDRIAVMYLGKIVETGPAETICKNPRHPYTQALLAASPIPDPKIERARRIGRIVLKGDIPSPLNPPAGCPFHTRCPEVMPVCRQNPPPPFKEYTPGHSTACHLLEKKKTE